MLIQQFAGTPRLLLIKHAFGSDSAKSLPVRFGFLFRSTPPGTLPEPRQIDHIPHVSLHHAIVRRAGF
jgi:hypothetical protein